MTKIEKVIKGFTGCLKGECPKDCPYIKEDCPQAVARDALELLKEREARVLTLEEVTGGDECWFEFRPAPVGRYADCYMNNNPEYTSAYFTGKSTSSLFSNKDYGKDWRCWSARPTDEQRKAVKWE